MNNTAIIGVVIVVIIVIAAGALLLTGKSTGTHPSNTTSAPTTVQGYTTIPATSSIANSSLEPTTTVAMAMNSSSYTVLVENSTALGSYLANASGFTLYTYGNDAQNSGLSSCYSSCATNWPPFYASTLSLSPGLSASDFNTITRVGGGLQLTYRGWPLYLFTADHSAGEVSGNGVAGFRLATT